MEPDQINAFVTLAAFLCVVASGMIGYFFRLSKELSDHKTHVAKYYMTKEESKEAVERMERNMELGLNRIYDLLNKRDVT